MDQLNKQKMPIRVQSKVNIHLSSTTKPQSNAKT
jgi:hypothetical protein